MIITETWRILVDGVDTPQTYDTEQQAWEAVESLRMAATAGNYTYRKDLKFRVEEDFHG